MRAFLLRDRFVLLMQGSTNYSLRSLLPHNSYIILMLIILLHIFLVVIALNIKLKQRKDFFFETVMQLRKVKIENTSSVLEPEALNINMVITPTHLMMPELNLGEVYQFRLDLKSVSSDQSTMPYKSPNKNDKLYGDVFDPTLRKKLQEAYANPKPKKQGVLNTWQTSGGTTLVDVGDGECISSLPKIDSRQRGTAWSMLRVKCGQTDSEKMMDNITADLEMRKHPLKTQ